MTDKGICIVLLLSVCQFSDRQGDLHRTVSVCVAGLFVTAEGDVTNMFCLRAALVTGKENVAVVFCSLYRGISCLRAALATGKENVTVVFCSLYRGSERERE